MRRKKYTIEEIKQIAIEKNGICLSNIYIHNKSNLDWKCNICDNIWSVPAKSIIVAKNWCPYCMGRHNNNIQTVKQLAIERGGLCLSLVYRDNKTNLSWKCGKCQYIWLARLDRVKSGTWCPNCRRSHGERKIADYLDSKNIEYKQEYRLGEKNMRFDFYLPKHNMAIEYDGSQHFSITRRYTPDIETLHKVQKLDIDKTLYCVKKSIRLIRICYKSFNNIDNILTQIFEYSDNILSVALYKS